MENISVFQGPFWFGFLSSSPMNLFNKLKKEEVKDKQKCNHTFTSDAITSFLRTIEINPYCRILYSTLHKAPLAVHQFLNKQLITGDAERERGFHTDLQLERTQKNKTFYVNDSYYKDIGVHKNFHYDRGHMAGASNYNSSQKYKSSTFSLANVIPQSSKNNQGVWNTFERYSKSLLEDGKCETIELISGPIYSSDTPYNQKQHPQVYKNEGLVFKKNGIVVPPKLYKIIKCNTHDGYSYSSGFIFENKDTTKKDNTKTLSQFQVPMQQIETETGMYFNINKNLRGKLFDHDIEGGKKKKIQLDRTFFMSLLAKQETINSMNNTKFRAQRNQIDLDLTPLQNKIQTMINSELKELEANNDCQKLCQYMKLSKDLFYLQKNTYHKREKDLTAKIDEKIIPCSQSNQQFYINKISYNLKNERRRFKYPLEEKLKESFLKKEEA